MRVLMIALDAAEPSLIEQWMDEGRLPNLARLREEGSYGRLGSSADWLAGSIWPTFHTGTLPADHGLYHFIQWHRERATLARPSASWLPQRVFWRDAAEAGRRVVAVDVPAVYEAEPFNGVEISGWCNTDVLAEPASYPPELMQWARRKFGPSQMGGEVYSLERLEALRRLRDDLVRWTAHTGDLASALMEQEDWELFLVNLTATHRGGHKLWDATALSGEAPPGAADEIRAGLEQVYAACDAQVGRLVEQAGPVTVLVFSLHGMGPNTSHVALLPEMLERVLGGGDDGLARPGMLQRLRAMVPNEWRARVKDLLPTGVQDRLTVFWRLGGVDLSSVSVFPLIADLQGYIRVNVKGRDAGGTVEPGAEYDRLCDEIIEGLTSFVDADSGEPVVAEVVRSDRLYAGGARCADLPDLMVRWSSAPASEHRTLRSPRHGSLDWSTPGRHPDGRSGNHRAEGFLLAKGEGVGAGAAIEGSHIVDLAPTVFGLLGLPPRPEWTGSAIPLRGG
jgi:predicted AlkP superfamily phosphohydrolase/phosphomutase